MAAPADRSPQAGHRPRADRSQQAGRDRLTGLAVRARGRGDGSQTAVHLAVRRRPPAAHVAARRWRSRSRLAAGSRTPRAGRAVPAGRGLADRAASAGRAVLAGQRERRRTGCPRSGPRHPRRRLARRGIRCGALRRAGVPRGRVGSPPPASSGVDSRRGAHSPKRDMRSSDSPSLTWSSAGASLAAASWPCESPGAAQGLPNLGCWSAPLCSSCISTTFAQCQPRFPAPVLLASPGKRAPRLQPLAPLAARSSPPH